MFKVITSILKKATFPLILLFITILICVRNYSPNTYLTGWDTLHPEFNYKMYWGRMLFGAWQSHQGLGSVSSQAHASEIPRVLIIGLMDLFFSTNLVRYLYAFLMLILGPLGVFFLIKKVVLKGRVDLASSIGSFGGGLFYLLNLGTLQHFNVPLEMFLTHFGFIGWVFLFLTKFYEEGRKRDLLLFIFISFLISSQAHTPTLFYVYFMFVLIYLLLMLLKGFLSKLSDLKLFVRRSVVLLGVSLAINFFWFLPSLYYGLEKGSEVPLSKIHHLFSEEAFLINKKYGNIKDASILKNFLFDWGIYSGDNSYSDLLGKWEIHLKKPLPTLLSYLIPLSVLTGLVVSVVKKDKYSFVWAVVSFVGIFFILNVNPPFGFIFKFFQNHIPLFKELFRFPFTKFSIILMLGYAVFFGYFVVYVSDLLIKSKKFLVVIFLLLFSSGIVYFSIPAFRGYLLNPAMRVNIPDRYFEMFKYFEGQEEYGRVVDLPIHSFWGWVTYSWNDRGTGYQGAGFLWFGIKQPLIDREFDRWNIANEQPYRELSTAVYSENPDLLIKTLEKYKIRWLLLDESVVAPGMDGKVLFYDQIKALLANTPGMFLDKDFGNGLWVYKYTPLKNYNRIETINSYFTVNNTLFKEYFDPIYAEYGDYVSGDNIHYQFVGFNTLDENINSNLIYSDDNSIYFKLPGISSDISNVDKIPAKLYLKQSESGSYIEILFDTYQIGRIEVPGEEAAILKINNDVFDLKQAKEDGFLGSSIVSLKEKPLISIYRIGEKKDIGNFLYSNLESCDPLEEGKNSSYSFSRVDSGFEISARDTVACVTVSLLNVGIKNTSDVVLVEFKSNSYSKATDFCMLDNSSGLCIDKFIKDGYFASTINGDSKKYDLRFFTDARNSDIELKKIYRDVSLYETDLIYSGLIDLNTTQALKVSDLLVFNKIDQFTLEPEEIFGNRRSCEKGRETDDSNFIKSDKGLVFKSSEGSLCDSYDFPLANHDTGYVLEVRANYFEGVPLRICVTNEYSKRCDLDVSLPTDKFENSYFYIIPPMGKGIGYTVNVSNYVFGNTLSRNEIQYVSLIPISYDLVKSVKSNDLTIAGNKNIYVLNEAYDSGWVLLCGITICNSEHIKVNNWSNGWVFDGDIPSNTKAVFWPQYFEYLGFAFLVLVIVFGFYYKEKKVLSLSEKSDIDIKPHSIDKS